MGEGSFLLAMFFTSESPDISLLARWATKLGNVISASDHGKFCQESPGGGGNNWKRGQRLHICLGKWQWGQVLTYF